MSERITFISKGGTIRLAQLFYFFAESRKIGRVRDSFLADSISKCRKLVVRGRHTSATKLSRFLVRDGVVPANLCQVRRCVTARVALSDDILTRKTIRTVTNNFHRVPHARSYAAHSAQEISPPVVPLRYATIYPSSLPSTIPAVRCSYNNFPFINYKSDRMIVSFVL